MTATDTVAQWDPVALIATAKELIHTSNYAKVNEARETLDKEIAQWVRVATSDAAVLGDAALAPRAAQSILQVWRLYAALEIELRQFKQATKVFESGTSCPFAGPSAAFWLQYAEFCVDRKKLSNARKVFVRALRAVAEENHGELWSRFHAFVVEHLDPNMSLEALQTQVFPDKTFSVVAPPVAAPVLQQQPTPPANGEANESQPKGITPSTNQQPALLVEQSAPVKVPTARGPILDKLSVSGDDKDRPSVDPSLAFVDKTGIDTPLASAAPSAGSKRKATDAASDTPVKQPKVEVVSVEHGDVKSFLKIPSTLPITPACPHLLFDQMETQKEIGNELLDRLSTVLSDNAVFQGVKDLFDTQRQRDRDMLYRWQDLVGMQMKEGSELFTRHAASEKEVADPRALIALKAKHLDARREFVHRCQMSQHQFIEICEIDRVGALKAQQISLENMKIPEMKVTADANEIELQRAIIGLILEAEKLSRGDTGKKSDHPVSGKKPSFAPRGRPGYPRSDSRDRDSFSRGGGRGGRSGFSRGGGSFGRNGGGRRPFSPPRGGRGPPKRHDGQTQSSYQGSSHRDFAQPHSGGRGYGGKDYSRDRPATHFDRGQDRRPQSYDRGPPREVAASAPYYGRSPPREVAAPPVRYADPPPAYSAPGNDRRYGSQDTYRRPASQSGGRSGGRAGPPPSRHVEYDRGDRYGAAQHAAPIAAAPPISRYGSELAAPPPPQRFSAPPPSSYDYAPPSSASYGYQSQPPPQQQQQPPIHYAQPAPVYQQAPPQQQHYQPPVQQQQLPPQRGYDAPPPSYQPQPHHVQPQYHHPPPQAQHRPAYATSPPRGGRGSGGYDRPRRGGRGGGRYGRR